MSNPWDLTHNRRAFATLLTLLVGSWFVAFGFTVWRLHNEALNNGMARAVAHVRNFEELLTQTLKVIDITASTLDPQLTPQGGMDAAAVERSLDAALRPTPYLRSLSILDSSGRIVASSEAQNIGVRIDTTSFFPMTRPEAEVLRIDTHWRGRDFASAQPSMLSSDAPIDLGFVPVLRKLSGLRKDYWLLAALNPDYFINHFSQLLDPAEGHVQWLRYDTRLLVSTNPSDTSNSAAASGISSELLAQSETGQFANRLPGGHQVLTAYRASSQFPVVLVVHVDQEAVLADWRAEARSLAIIVVPVLLALSIVSMLVWRRQRRIAMQQVELDLERRRAATVFDASFDAIILTKPDGAILAINPACERLNGYSAAEAIGQNPRILNSGKQDAEFYRTMWDDLIQIGRWQGEVVNRRKDGSLYYGMLTISAVKDSNGQLMHYVAVTTDISARKSEEVQMAEHAAALSLAKDAAEAANRAKSAFLANMSHELRTPMNGVLGMIELAKRRMADAKGLDQLDKAKLSAERLLRVLNDILDISKVEAERMVFESIPLQISAVIASLTSTLDHKATEKGLRLVIDLPAEIANAPLKGDPLRLGQILFNLVDNAIKFTERGEVTLRARSVGETPEVLQVRFEVRDTGLGIDPEAQTRLFQSFEQADNSMTRKYGGTGLGLAICKRIIQLMGGEIGVESTPGQGSTFWFVVPLKKPEQSAVPPAPTFTALTTEQLLLNEYAGTRVLLAEDEPVNQEVSRSLLEDVGLVVDVAEDGGIAVAMAQRSHYDLILMDMQMPQMNGVEATQAIRTNSLNMTTPILAMTANAFDEDRQVCIDAGMNDHIAKPVNPDKLYEMLLAWLSR